MFANPCTMQDGRGERFLLRQYGAGMCKHRKCLRTLWARDNWSRTQESGQGTGSLPEATLPIEPPFEPDERGFAPSFFLQLERVREHLLFAEGSGALADVGSKARRPGEGTRDLPLLVQNDVHDGPPVSSRHHCRELNRSPERVTVRSGRT